MSLIRIDPNPGRRQLAVFGVVWLAFFAIVGMAALKHGGAAAGATLIALGVLVPASGWVWPRFLRAVYLALAYATFPLGLVLSWVLLAAVYYLVLTPIGLFMRAIGHDPLNRSGDARAGSYWVAREEDEGRGSYFRQF
jgi:hypothetical protein